MEITTNNFHFNLSAASLSEFFTLERNDHKFSLENRRLWGDLTAALRYLKGAYKQEGSQLFERAERLWMPRPWRCSRPGWMEPWAAWSGIKWGGFWPCLWRWGWRFMVLEAPSNLGHSVVQ